MLTVTPLIKHGHRERMHAHNSSACCARLPRTHHREREVHALVKAECSAFIMVIHMSHVPAFRICFVDGCRQRIHNMLRCTSVAAEF